MGLLGLGLKYMQKPDKKHHERNGMHLKVDLGLDTRKNLKSFRMKDRLQKMVSLYGQLMINASNLESQINIQDIANRH